MKKLSLLAVGSLFLTAAIWGLSYSAQAEAMKSMQPLSFVFLRYLIGSAMLVPVLFFRKNALDRKLLTGGIVCGICLAGGEILQQFGLLYTSAGKAGFLTALYVIMVPLIGIFVRQKSDWKIWIAALLSVAGTYFLCSDGTLNHFGNFGDGLIVICALFFAFQFIAIARFAPEADALLLAAAEFLTVAVISGVAALFAGEHCSSSSVVATAKPLLYCGVIAIGFAITVQVSVQKYVHPATVSIILSTASVFAVIWGWCLLDEHYSLQNLLGCGIIFMAVILVQLPSRSGADEPGGQG
ncbi:MAG: DMT family transporter [Lentisphaeria bacterium]|nr:DMT family transporter [Lentisphaeria bacterium]